VISGSGSGRCIFSPASGDDVNCYGTDGLALNVDGNGVCTGRTCFFSSDRTTHCQC
jgi:hypothetical protein